MNDFINAVLFVVLAGSLGISLDARDEQKSHSAADAQTQQKRELKRDISAAKLCRESIGGGFSWTAAGELVCTPRTVRGIY